MGNLSCVIVHACNCCPSMVSSEWMTMSSRPSSYHFQQHYFVRALSSEALFVQLNICFSGSVATLTSNRGNSRMCFSLDPSAMEEG